MDIAEEEMSRVHHAVGRALLEQIHVVYGRQIPPHRICDALSTYLTALTTLVMDVVCVSGVPVDEAPSVVAEALRITIRHNEDYVREVSEEAHDMNPFDVLHDLYARPNSEKN